MLRSSSGSVRLRARSLGCSIVSDLHRSYSPDDVREPETAVRARVIGAAGPAPDADALRTSYLDVLKLCLCDLGGVGSRTISWTGDRRVFSRELSGDQQMGWRISGRDWPLNALTMVGLRRLDDLQTCVESVVREEIEGDLIEAGAWRGGSSILMRATLDALGARDRTVWVADSFQGFPAPEEDAAPEDRELETDMSPLGFLAPSLEEVQGYFARFGLERGLRFVPGFFEETMEQLRGRRWSVVRLDADTYKATRLTLEALYPCLSVGGYLVSDDYFFLPACRRAIDEFRSEHGITEPIEQVDFNGARWRREREEPGLAGDLSEAPPISRDASSLRARATQTVDRVPTDRELELEDEVSVLQARLQTVEAQLEALRSSPLAGPTAWWSQRKASRGARS